MVASDFQRVTQLAPLHPAVSEFPHSSFLCALAAPQSPKQLRHACDGSGVPAGRQEPSARVCLIPDGFADVCSSITDPPGGLPENLIHNDTGRIGSDILPGDQLNLVLRNDGQIRSILVFDGTMDRRLRNPDTATVESGRYRRGIDTLLACVADANGGSGIRRLRARYELWYLKLRMV